MQPMQTSHPYSVIRNGLLKSVYLKLHGSSISTDNNASNITCICMKQKIFWWFQEHCIKRMCKYYLVQLTSLQCYMNKRFAYTDYAHLYIYTYMHKYELCVHVQVIKISI